MSRHPHIPLRLMGLVAALVWAGCTGPAGAPGVETPQVTAPGGPSAATAEPPSPTASTGPSPAATEPPATATASPTATEPQATATARPAPTGLLEPVSKGYSVGRDFVPGDLVELTGVPVTRSGVRLRKPVCEALNLMLADARKQGLGIMVLSGYRSFEEQEVVYAAAVRASGEAEASRYSARPGHSEHQLGTTIDFTSPTVHYDLVESFGQTLEGVWLRDQAHRYGFVLSYPEGKEAVTGYMYEPWHFRYVGEEIAMAVMRSGLTLGQYLGGRG